MKVILKKAVEHVGEAGAVIEVKDGYARNFLIPRGLAQVFTPGALAVLERRKKTQDQKSATRLEGAKEVAERLRVLELTLAREAGVEDKLHGSVTSQDIREALAQKGVQVDKHAVVLETPIRKLGRFSVPVKLHSDVEASLNVWVVKA